MARGDWWYVNLPKEQEAAVEEILRKEGRKYGLVDKNTLVRTLVADFITKYEEKHGIVAARKAIRAPGDQDYPQPVE